MAENCNLATPDSLPVVAAWLAPCCPVWHWQQHSNVLLHARSPLLIHADKVQVTHCLTALHPDTEKLDRTGAKIPFHLVEHSTKQHPILQAYVKVEDTTGPWLPFRTSLSCTHLHDAQRLCGRRQGLHAERRQAVLQAKSYADDFSRCKFNGAEFREDCALWVFHSNQESMLKFSVTGLPDFPCGDVTGNSFVLLSYKPFLLLIFTDSLCELRCAEESSQTQVQGSPYRLRRLRTLFALSRPSRLKSLQTGGGLACSSSPCLVHLTGLAAGVKRCAFLIAQRGGDDNLKPSLRGRLVMTSQGYGVLPFLEFVRTSSGASHEWSGISQATIMGFDNGCPKQCEAINYLMPEGDTCIAVEQPQGRLAGRRPTNNCPARGSRAEIQQQTATPAPNCQGLGIRPNRIYIHSQNKARARWPHAHLAMPQLACHGHVAGIVLSLTVTAVQSGTSTRLSSRECNIICAHVTRVSEVFPPTVTAVATRSATTLADIEREDSCAHCALPCHPPPLCFTEKKQPRARPPLSHKFWNPAERKIVRMESSRGSVIKQLSFVYRVGETTIQDIGNNKSKLIEFASNADKSIGE
ncbi:hypothetical protein PR048_002358 [Dryococelus australis]|uniref:Uncharacterized protein n=1 Tax=Dryococelus australis TaxID=614101 RepID=A0ABQ9IK26_9NEOP|nr:hypothetical protein PR048_002358 [Dryococelus australis]